MSTLWIRLLDTIEAKAPAAEVRHLARLLASVQLPVTEWAWVGGRVRYNTRSPFVRLRQLAVKARAVGGTREMQNLIGECRARLEKGPPDIVLPTLPFRRDIDG